MISDKALEFLDFYRTSLAHSTKFIREGNSDSLKIYSFTAKEFQLQIDVIMMNESITDEEKLFIIKSLNKHLIDLCG